MATKVINIKNAPKGFMKVDGIQLDGYVYIGRPCYFGNPIQISGKYGDYKCPVCGNYHYDAGSTLPCFKSHFLHMMCTDMAFARRALMLRDLTLVCYCKPGPCHGDIMAYIIDNL